MHPLAPLAAALAIATAPGGAPGPDPREPAASRQARRPQRGAAPEIAGVHSEAGGAGAAAAARGDRATAAASWPAGDQRAENLLAGPARCVLRYLDAVRHAGPRPDPRSGRLPAPRAGDYAPVRALTAPRTLEDIARRTAGGEDHPLAPWRDAARAQVLEWFQLVAVRRAPRGAAVVTVAERFWRAPGAALDRRVSEYLVARVDGAWRVVDRSPGMPFEDAALEHGYEGFFDDPGSPR